jgi:hypothetical protein
VLFRCFSRPLIAFAEQSYSLPPLRRSLPILFYARPRLSSPQQSCSLHILLVSSPRVSNATFFIAEHGFAVANPILALPLLIYAIPWLCLAHPLNAAAKLGIAEPLHRFSVHCRRISEPFRLNGNGGMPGHFFKPPGQLVLEDFRLELCPGGVHGYRPRETARFNGGRQTLVVHRNVVGAKHFAALSDG